MRASRTTELNPPRPFASARKGRDRSRASEQAEDEETRRARLGHCLDRSCDFIKPLDKSSSGSHLIMRTDQLIDYLRANGGARLSWPPRSNFVAIIVIRALLSNWPVGRPASWPTIQLAGM